MERQAFATDAQRIRLAGIARQRFGATLTRQQLMDDLYGGAASGVDRSVDLHVKNLRRKLSLVSNRRVRFETVYGVGYRFVAGEKK